MKDGGSSYCYILQFSVLPLQVSISNGGLKEWQ